MATVERPARLSDLHMIVLGTIARLASADVDHIAEWLGVPVVVAAAVCADLEAAGACYARHRTLKVSLGT